MKELQLMVRRSPIWLKATFVILGVLWGYWLSGTWPASPLVEYVPPRFEDLEIVQGTLSFTRRSRSSGGEIQIHLEGGKKLVLSCSPPNTLPEACFHKNTGGEWLDYREKLNGQIVKVWWRLEPDVPYGGRMYQMQVGEGIFFKYQDQVDYYVRYHQKGGGRNGNFGLVLLLITVLVIYASLKGSK